MAANENSVPVVPNSLADAELPPEPNGRESRFSEDIRARGLRTQTARGTIINAAFQVGLAGLDLLQRVTIVAFLTAEEFGLWGSLVVTLMLVLFLKDVGVSDKYVQQSDEDQELAFQHAFTVDFALGLIVTALAIVVIPPAALAYGKPELIAPGLVTCLVLLGNSLQSPMWVYYRSMDFFRMRVLQATTPVVTFVFSIGLAIAGAGYWALVAGAVIGALAGAVVAVTNCPYPIRLRLAKGTLREYVSFSWPLVVANGGNVISTQVAALLSTRLLGLAQTGAIALAASVVGFTDGVDGIVTRTLYPAICAVTDRMDLLYEAFIKSNRLALMWGVPFGLAISLFAADLVHFVIGDRWVLAIGLLQAFGVIAAIDQVGFNWSAFMRALNRTRPLAVLAIANLVAFLAIPTPLLVIYGLKGFAYGSVGAQVVNLVGRAYYLRQLFPRFRILRHAARAAAPVVPGTAIVLVARQLESGTRSPVQAVFELVVFVLLAAGATFVLERSLIREMVGYVRRGTASRAPQPTLG